MAARGARRALGRDAYIYGRSRIDEDEDDGRLGHGRPRASMGTRSRTRATHQQDRTG
jgi:hypothetical protein